MSCSPSRCTRSPSLQPRVRAPACNPVRPACNPACVRPACSRTFHSQPACPPSLSQVRTLTQALAEHQARAFTTIPDPSPSPTPTPTPNSNPLTLTLTLALPLSYP